MKKILVVEDNEDICTILKRRLEKLGFAVDVVRGGYSFLGYLRAAEPPDVVVLDLVLPERSGIELLCSLKSVWQNTRVFIFSAHAEYKDREMLQEYICGFFLKSDGMNNLIEQLKKEL